MNEPVVAIYYSALQFNIVCLWLQQIICLESVATNI